MEKQIILIILKKLTCYQIMLKQFTKMSRCILTLNKLRHFHSMCSTALCCLQVHTSTPWQEYQRDIAPDADPCMPPRKVSMCEIGDQLPTLAYGVQLKRINIMQVLMYIFRVDLNP